MNTNDLTEKYRPASFSELLGQSAVAKELKGYVANGRDGNLAFIGPSGSGKTSAAKILAKLLCGDPTLSFGYKYLGVEQCTSAIAVSRELINFEMYRPPLLIGSKRVIHIDDFHLMKDEVRESLRNAIEMRESNRVLIVTCEHMKKWSSAMKSRFPRKIHFKNVPASVALQKINDTWTAEGRKEKVPTLEQLGFQVAEHYNLRSVLGAVETYIDRGCIALEEVPVVAEKKLSPSRINARLAIDAVRSLRGEGIQADDAYEMLQTDPALMASVRDSSPKLMKYNLPPKKDSFRRFCGKW